VNIAAFGNTVAMSTVRGPNEISVSEIFADPHRNGFLTGIKVNEARNITAGVFLMQTLLKRPDFAHLTVSLE
jgi:hypothetical protein